MNEPGDGLSALSGLDKVLDLTKAEMEALVQAHVFGDRPAPENPNPTEKTVRELREEHGLTREELAEGMQISERDLMLLEASGQKYLALDREWFALIAEPYGYNKVFWYPPTKAVSEWERAIRLLDGFAVMAEVLDSEPLLAILGDAISVAREELDGCRRLHENFEAQEERIRFETAYHPTRRAGVLRGSGLYRVSRFAHLAGA